MKIKKITKLEELEDTGTLTVADYHNFLLTSGIFVKNSADGKGTQIDTVGGRDTLTEKIEDLEWFYHKLYRSLDVPANRREKESPFTAVTANNLDVEREEIKFFKSVVKKRKRFNELFYDLLKKDLISTKVLTLKDWKNLRKGIKIKYKNNNDYAHSKFLANLETKMSIAETAFQISQEQQMFSKDWILKNIMHFTDEEILKMKKDIEKEPKPPEGDDFSPY